MGYGFIRFTSLAAGDYQITFQAKWGSVDIKDYTVQVYAKSSVKITDTAGKTSYADIPFKKASTSPVVPSNNDTTTNNNTTPTNTTNNTTPSTPVNTTPNISLSDLQMHLPMAIACTTCNYDKVIKSYYYTKSGYYSTSEYYFEYGVATKWYNVDTDVTLTTKNAIMAVNNTMPIITTSNADGTISLTNECKVDPVVNPSCSYLVRVDSGITWKVNLIDYEFA
jgi:hypothetical protein